MNKLLKSIFYQFYVWACKYNFANSPHLSAMYMLSLFLSINIACLSMIVNFLLGYDEMFLLKSRSLIILILFVMITIIYFLYTKDKRYILLFKEFDSKSPIQKKYIRHFTIFYLAVSIILFFLVAFVLGLHHRGIL